MSEKMKLYITSGQRIAASARQGWFTDFVAGLIVAVVVVTLLYVKDKSVVEQALLGGLGVLVSGFYLVRGFCRFKS